MCKNATALMIIMLDYLELDTKVSDASMETMKSDDCRGVLRDDRDVNSMLAVMQERTRFSCKDG